MNTKKIVFFWTMFVCCAWMVFPQSFGSVTNDKPEAEVVVDDQRGFTAQVDVDTNLFHVTQTEYSDAKERYKRTNSFLIDNYPFGGFNVLDDTNVAFGYNGVWYGGNLSLNKDGLGGIKAWVQFFDGKLKITAGNDIGYGYADSQGADAGLRVYDDNVRTNNDGLYDADDESIDSSKNPDNITQDKGILFELNLDLFKIAFAGGGNMTDVAENIGSVVAATNEDPIYGYNFQYGLNVGGKLGGLAKVNVAYILQGDKDVARYEYNGVAGRIIPLAADAETWNHLFGLYASFYPWSDDRLGITLGYAGELTQYLEEFHASDKTIMPRVFKNGVNLTARYKTGKLTIKTDHNYSFWSDKNYKIYYLYRPDASTMKDYGLLPTTAPNSSVSEVSHIFLWNGIGASYRFTDILEGSIYTRNLLRTDETPEYKMTNSYFSLELKSTFRFGPSVEAYAGITWHYTGRTVSKSLPEYLGGLSSDSGHEFTTGNQPKETTDYVNMIQIPVGITVKLQ
jgi:hypothetical protein